jgi:DNA-binding response OmpR family regulator
MQKILIIDDDIQTTRLLDLLLTERGYKTTSVNDSSLAIQVAKSTIPDLIILDLMMPEPDGFKVCRMLREDTQFIFTPILIVTALDDTDSKIVAFGAGADNYIIKPYDVDELAETIEIMLSDEESDSQT